MTKKKFGLSSTLNKNKTEQPVLPEKVPLQKTIKDVEEVKEKVDALHTTPEPPVEEVAAPSPEVVEEEAVEEQEAASAEPAAVSKPTKTKKPTKKADAVVAKEERIVRITIDTPKSIHRQLKIKSINADITIRDYVLQLIQKDLGIK